jgi:hypothetical protein
MILGITTNSCLYALKHTNSFSEHTNQISSDYIKFGEIEPAKFCRAVEAKVASRSEYDF